ncbi:MAG: hypothetical protein ACREOG_22165, partial [Gemmatimonadaceae bacterium]
MLHVAPRVGDESARLIQSALSKTSETAGIANLVIVSDRPSAYELASIARRSGSQLTPLTVPARANQLLQRNPPAVAGTPSDLLRLVRSTALKLESVRQVVLLWADALLVNERHVSDLETLLGELPREADRTLIVEQDTAAVESFVERMALKPRRLMHEIAAPPNPRSVGYLVVAAEQRGTMLQRLLDTREATNIAVVADDERAAREATEALEALGLDVPGDVRVVGSHEVVDAALVVWYGVPSTLERVATLSEA